MREQMLCHDDECERAGQCRRFQDRLKYLGARHHLTLRSVGGRGRDCHFFLALPAGPEPRHHPQEARP